MTTLFRSLPAILAPLMGVGCAGWAEPETVTVEARPLAPESVRHESIASLESGERLIRVRRAFRVPDACRELSGQVVRAGDYLALRLVSLPAATGCPAAEAYLAYTATIQGVAPGEYRLRVIHGYPDERRRSEVVLEHPVRVAGRPGALPVRASGRWKPWN